MKNIKVAIIEDDHEIRHLLSIIIDKTDGYMCKQLYPDCESAIPEIMQYVPDIVLMDIDLPLMNGIEGVIHLRNKGFENPILMLTIHADSDHVFDS